MNTSTQRRFEIGLIGAVLVAFNIPLLHGGFARPFVFLPSAVRDGEWWRLFTHPFVHVSWYHLLLDGGAFFVLYRSLVETKSAKRIAYVLATVTGSLLMCLLLPSAITCRGLCGLSGIAHGLMAISAMEMMTHRGSDTTSFRVGMISFVIVLGKSVIEAITGHAMFDFLYFGMLGSPIAICHLGGVLSGIAIYSAMNRERVFAMFQPRTTLMTT